jgi:hypothetical protein
MPMSGRSGPGGGLGHLRDDLGGHAAGTGAVLTLLSTPPEHRGLDLADAMYEAVMRSILTDVPTLPADSAAAVAVRAVAPKLPMLTDAERALLAEWLDRAGEAQPPPVLQPAPTENAEHP